MKSLASVSLCPRFLSRRFKLHLLHDLLKFQPQALVQCSQSQLITLQRESARSQIEPKAETPTAASISVTTAFLRCPSTACCILATAS